MLTPPEPNGVGLRWLEATGDLRQQTQVGPCHLNDEVCCLCHELETPVPNRLDQIAFSVVQLGDGEYIAGLRLVPDKGRAIALGYKADGTECVLYIFVPAGLRPGRRIKGNSRNSMRPGGWAKIAMGWMYTRCSKDEAPCSLGANSSHQSRVRCNLAAEILFF